METDEAQAYDKLREVLTELYGNRISDQHKQFIAGITLLASLAYAGKLGKGIESLQGALYEQSY